MRISIGPNIGPIRVSRTVYQSRHRPPPDDFSYLYDLTGPQTLAPPAHFTTLGAILGAAALPFYYAAITLYLALIAPALITLAALCDAVALPFRYHDTNCDCLRPCTCDTRVNPSAYTPLAPRLAPFLYAARHRYQSPPAPGTTTTFSTPFTPLTDPTTPRPTTNLHPHPHLNARHANDFTIPRRRCAITGTLIYLALFLPWPHLITPAAHLTAYIYDMIREIVYSVQHPDHVYTPPA